MLRRILFLTAALIAVALLVPWPTSRAQTETLADRITADLTAATKVVVGVVRRGRPTKGTGDRITTNLVIQPTRTLKGTPSANNMTFDIEGGTVGDLTMQTEWTPLLTVGDKVVVLLDGNGALMTGQAIYRLSGATDILDESTLTLADVEGYLE